MFRLRPYQPPTEALKFGAVKLSSCSCARILPRTLSGALDIVREIVFLPRASFYSAGCSIYWNINVCLSCVKLVAFFYTASVTAAVGDALTMVVIEVN
jgi:hypothetical protein